MREVFISYKSNERELGNNDETIANELCKQLEAAGITCWIAPRDIEPGARSYEGAIIRAIKGCKILLLVFSKYSNESDDVFKEVANAARRKKEIIPFRIDDSELSDDFEYHLGSVHWFDASDGVSKRIPNLIEALKRKLGKVNDPEESSVQHFEAHEAENLEIKTHDINRNEAAVNEDASLSDSKDEKSPSMSNTVVGAKETDADANVMLTDDKLSAFGADKSDLLKSSEETSIKAFNINGVSFNMVRVDGGSFMMGADRTSDSERAHEEMVSSFYIGDKQVTCSLWHKVFGSTLFVRENLWKLSNAQSGLPKVNVSWHDCQLFVKRLNELTGVKETGFEFCLPTEVQWEFAARGGKKSRGYKYAGSDYIQEVAWYALPQSKPKPVGQKKPNELGLYDMSGNVWEWCQDECYYYPEELFFTHVLTKDLEHAGRVYRGGSFRSNHEKDLKVTSRNVCKPDVTRNDLGFRLALRALE